MQGITNDVEIVNIKNIFVLNIPLKIFDNLENMFISINIIPRRNIVVLLFFLPNDFFKHSDEKFKNIEIFRNTAAVHKPI